MATSEKFIQPSIPRFDGHYDHWSMLMENFLRSKEMWNLVNEWIPVPVIRTTSTSEVQRKSVEEARLKDLTPIIKITSISTVCKGQEF